MAPDRIFAEWPDQMPGFTFDPAYWAEAGKLLEYPPILLVLHCGSIGTDIHRHFKDPSARPGETGAVRCPDGAWRRQVSSTLAWRPGHGLVQMVSLRREQWHAGGTRWREHPRVNAISWSIELPGPPGAYRPPEQLEALRAAAECLCAINPRLRCWTRHSNLQATKRDPGPGVPEDWAAGLLERG